LFWQLPRRIGFLGVTEALELIDNPLPVICHGTSLVLADRRFPGGSDGHLTDAGGAVRAHSEVMSLSTAVDVLLIGAAVVWVLVRQIRLARVKPRLLVLAPLVLAYFGIRALPASTWHTGADLGLLAVSAVVSVTLGLWRGQTIKVWREDDGTWSRQGSMRTLALWGALIVARGLLYAVDAAAGHREASGLGAVLVTLALSFAAQNAVIAVRMTVAPALAGGQPAMADAGRGPVIAPRRTTRRAARGAAGEDLHARRHERIQARRQERRERRAGRY
jgi:hypothetical protein